MKSDIARKALILMAAGVAILTMVVIASLVLIARSQDYAANVRAERDLRKAAISIFTDLLDAETGQRGFLLTGRNEYLETYSAVAPRIQSDLADLNQAMTQSAVSAAQVAALTATAEKKMAELQQTVDLYRAGRTDEALAVVKSDQGQRLMQEARRTLTPLIANAEENINGRLSDLDIAAQRLAWLNGLGGIVLIALAIAAYYILSQYTKMLIAAREEVMKLNENLEDRVADRTTALTRANDEIQRFAYIVSHDLRAPLVNIMGFTSELESGTATLNTYFDNDAPTDDQKAAAAAAAKEDIPEALQFIRTSTVKMDKLIGAILKLSREGRRELKRERVDLTELIETAAASVQHQVESSGAKIEISGPLPSVVADRLALDQVFGNLIDNAVKYLSRDRAGLITISGEETGGRVKIAVADNGRGIDHNDRERIFELFRRAGQQDRPGEGVGLAHVRALVRRMGGDVTVSPNKSQGSVFEVNLPKKAFFREERADSA